MSPQIKNSDCELYKYFTVAYSLFINLIKFAKRSVYRANILKLDYLASNSIALTSEVCSAQ